MVHNGIEYGKKIRQIAAHIIFLVAKEWFSETQFIFLIFRWHATDCWSLSFDEGCHRIVTSRNGRHFFRLESWSSWLFSYRNHCQYSTVQGKLSSIFKNNGILLPKLFWPTVRKNCSSDREKLFKIEAEGWEFSKILRSLEQFIQTVKGQNNFW